MVKLLIYIIFFHLMFKNYLMHNFILMLEIHLYQYKELKFRLKMEDHKINLFKRLKKFNRLFRMRIVYFTLQRKLHNIKPMMIVGLCTKVRFMI
jgi:hypothetical protein